MTFFTVDYLGWSTAGSVRDDVVGLRLQAFVGMFNLYRLHVRSHLVRNVNPM